MQNLRNPEGLVQWRVCFLGEDIQDMVGNANPLSSVGDFRNTCQSLKGKLEFLFFFLQFLWCFIVLHINETLRETLLYKWPRV